MVAGKTGALSWSLRVGALVQSQSKTTRKIVAMRIPNFECRKLQLKVLIIAKRELGNSMVPSVRLESNVGALQSAKNKGNGHLLVNS